MLLKVGSFLIASFRFERGGLASVGIRTYPTVQDRAKDFSLSLVNEWLECFLAALETYCWIFGERLLPSADLLGGGLLIHGISPPLILGGRGDLKISDQNNWGDLSKKLNLGEAKFKGGPKILGGEAYERSWYKGAYLPPPPFLEIPDVPPFIGLSGKQKY